ncbi:MAG: tetratricopeptide repeat protein, partial [Verrucomicrobiota bacterium]
AAVLVLVTVVLYWPATRCDFLTLDDLDLTGNSYVLKGLSWESIRWSLFNSVNGGWLPIHTWSHMLAVQVFGLNPWGHHLINVVLHALNAALVFAWLRQMTGATWRSLLVAALFALHPLRVEPVLWVTERREVLCACFGLLALMAYVRYAQRRMQNAECRMQKPEAEGRWSVVRGPWSLSQLPASSFYRLSLLFLALGLLSKPTIVTWPFVMLLLDYWPLGRMQNAECRMQNAEAGDTDHAPRNTLHVSRFTFYSRQAQILWRLVREKIPFFVLIVLSSALLMVIQRLDNSLGWDRANPLGARLGNAVYSYGWYLGKLFWPADLAAFYTHTGYWPLGQVALAGGLILGVSALVGLGWRRHPYLLVGWLWYCGTLVPMSQVVQTWKTARADRWTYLPSLGVLILIVWGAGELTRRWRYQVLGWSVAGGVTLVLCLALTRGQMSYWKDSETLVRHSLAVTGNNEVSLGMLGAALDKKGQTDEAIRYYREALRLEPDNPVIRHFLGMALGRRGQLDEAITQFQETVRLAPAYPLAHYNLGNTLLEKGRIDEAIRQYQEVIRLLPNYGEPHNNLGLALARKGQTEEAITQYQEALRLQPDDPDIHFNLGAVFARRGQLDEAIRHYQETLRRQPDRAEAHNNLGAAFQQQGHTGEAIREFQEALRLKPDYAGARRNLDAVLAAQANPSLLPGTPTNSRN